MSYAIHGRMAKLSSYRELLVWQKSMTLAERCYRMTRRFKRDDQVVLGHEIRKSCVSIPSNIAEGFGRHYTAEYIHHLRFSNGSNNELQTQVELSRRVEIVGSEEGVSGISCVRRVDHYTAGLVKRPS